MKKIIFSLVLASLLVGGSSVQAVSYGERDISSFSLDELKTILTQIQKKIAEMQSSAKSCFVSNSDLSIGDGEAGVLTADVKRLQDFLREKGFLSYKSTGYFGKLTKTALIAYQKNQGISETGEFDNATRAKMHASTCSTGKEYDSSIEKKKTEDKKYEEKKKESEKDKSGKTGSVSSLSISGSGATVSWGVEGYSSQGFKVVWSKTANPTYPTRSTDKYYYTSNAYERSTVLDAFDGSGTYYVRVCEYLGGACGVYSNEITVNL